MTNQTYLSSYIQGCASGTLKMGDCGPVWQIAVILALLTAAIGALVFLRLVADRQLREKPERS